MNYLYKNKKSKVNRTNKVLLMYLVAALLCGSSEAADSEDNPFANPRTDGVSASKNVAEKHKAASDSSSNEVKGEQAADTQSSSNSSSSNSGSWVSAPDEKITNVSSKKSEERTTPKKDVYVMTDYEYHQWIEAARENDVKIIQSFIDKGVNIDEARDNDGTALWNAVREEQLDAVKLLIENGADVNYCSKVYSKLSAEDLIDKNKYPIDTTKLLSDEDAYLADRYNVLESPLIAAVECERFEVKSEDIVEIVKILLKNGADPNIRVGNGGITALMIASGHGDEEIVKSLLPETNNEAVLDLLYDSKYKHPKEKEYIEKKAKATKVLKANLDDKDEEGRTALMFAVASRCNYSENKFSIVKLLLDEGANPNIQDKNGKTPLILSVESEEFYEDDDRVGVVKLLLDKGADANLQDEDGETALMRAVSADELYFRVKIEESLELNSTDRVKIVKLLLDKGADTNLRDNDGKTSLMRVVQSKNVPNQNRVELVKLLLDKGADPNLQDKKGRTAFRYVQNRIFSNIKDGQLNKEGEIYVKIAKLLNPNLTEKEIRSNAISANKVFFDRLKTAKAAKAKKQLLSKGG